MEAWEAEEERFEMMSDEEKEDLVFMRCKCSRGCDECLGISNRDFL